MTSRNDWRPFADLHGMVRLVLIVDWDPIGVFGHPRALDEYDSYAEGIVSLMQVGASSEAVAAHLLSLERKNMGLRGRVANAEQAAQKLITLYKMSLPDESE
jgi:hypothetical protein